MLILIKFSDYLVIQYRHFKFFRDMQFPWRPAAAKFIKSSLLRSNFLSSIVGLGVLIYLHILLKLGCRKDEYFYPIIIAAPMQLGPVIKYSIYVTVLYCANSL